MYNNQTVKEAYLRKIFPKFEPNSLRSYDHNSIIIYRGLMISVLLTDQKMHKVLSWLV